jgi:hypothetical protein
LAGHAFIATGLLSASFVYYRDARQWIKQLAEQTQQSESGTA